MCVCLGGEALPCLRTMQCHVQMLLFSHHRSHYHGNQQKTSLPGARENWGSLSKERTVSGHVL